VAGRTVNRVKIIISVTVVIIGLGGLLGGSWFLGLYALHQNNQNWCSALEILTATKVDAPADPAANPSRVQAYKLYTDFMTLESRFGC
jgi:hypothetical protein